MRMSKRSPGPWKVLDRNLLLLSLVKGHRPKPIVEDCHMQARSCIAEVHDAPDLLLPHQKGQSHASPLLCRCPMGAISDGSRLAPTKPHLLQEEGRRKQ